ncbi:MAG: hypothetical protein HY728_00225 [Candidatus Rokubacteria bacterium]|nr:hypothetical protein [Candidatus Rokubacteria bacterium]
MQTWVQLLIVLCVVVVTVALVPAILALRRAVERADRALAIVEQELRPLAANVEALVGDLRALSAETRGGIARVVGLTTRAQDLFESVGRVLAAVAGLTRAGQLVGVVTGLKAGLEVFLHRLRRQQGDNHE